MSVIDPFHPDRFGKAMWVLYGSKAWPMTLCARTAGEPTSPSIWGYSEYRRSPGFRTLGRDLRAWIDERTKVDGAPPLFYGSLEEMLTELRRWLTPNPKVLK